MICTIFNMVGILVCLFTTNAIAKNIDTFKTPLRQFGAGQLTSNGAYSPDGKYFLIYFREFHIFGKLTQ